MLTLGALPVSAVALWVGHAVRTEIVAFIAVCITDDYVSVGNGIEEGIHIQLIVGSFIKKAFHGVAAGIIEYLLIDGERRSKLCVVRKFDKDHQIVELSGVGRFGVAVISHA